MAEMYRAQDGCFDLNAAYIRMYSTSIAKMYQFELPTVPQPGSESRSVLSGKTLPSAAFITQKIRTATSNFSMPVPALATVSMSAH